ncbi:hypothetical protein BDV35DRAFT_69366 [Aspergillus flavus]|uniref:Uncharacterized protein n=1 Tax=Aspergillus flavus TaxID=5059 RepID=A0A5N6GHX9_ASPFL|nr:hypothetical protein BDV35DRAFT_69366 [Aspergillus flavus]
MDYSVDLTVALLLRMTSLGTLEAITTISPSAIYIWAYIIFKSWNPSGMPFVDWPVPCMS